MVDALHYFQVDPYLFVDFERSLLFFVNSSGALLDLGPFFSAPFELS